MDLQKDDKCLHWEYKNGAVFRPFGGLAGTRIRRLAGVPEGRLRTRRPAAGCADHGVKKL